MPSIEELSARRQAAQAGISTGASMASIHDPALISAAMDAVPSIEQSMAFSAFRGSRTIFGGAFKKTPMPFGSPGDLARRTKSRFNPFNLSRFAYMERLDPNMGKKGFGGFGANNRVRTVDNPFYRENASMFQAGRAINFGLGKYLGTSTGSRGFLARQLPTLAEGTVAPYFTGGFMSTLFSSGRIARGARIGARSLSPSTAGNVLSYLKVANPSIVTALGGEELAGAALKSMSTTSSSQILAMSGKGLYNQLLGGAVSVARGPIDDLSAQTILKASRLSGQVITETGSLGVQFASTMAGRGAILQTEGLAYGGFTAGERMGVKGFFGGLRAAYTGEGVARAGSKYAEIALRSEALGYGARGSAAREVAARGFLRASGKLAASPVGQKVLTMAGTKMAARFAAAAGITAASGPAAPVVGAVMTAWMIYDFAKLGGALIGAGIKGTVQTASQAIRSGEGGINKAPMSGLNGFGFQDTEASATSRQRGVMAIQNSRLNARSVLGSEAGMMYSHFG